MRLLIGQDAIVARWAGERLDGVFLPPFVALGIIDRRGILRGAFIIKALNSTACELSLYSERALTNGVMRSMFEIMFEKFGFCRCVIHTSRRNKAIKRAAPKMGFKFECKATDYYGPNVDALQFAMTPPTCRWLKRYGSSRQSLRDQEAQRPRADERRGGAGAGLSAEHERRL